MAVALAVAVFVAAVMIAAIEPVTSHAAAPERVGAVEPYVAVSIVAPANGETIHDNLGNVQVHIAIEPPLQARAGHRLRLALDGEPIAELTSAQPHTLREMERGTHVLSATVIDREGAELISSESVTFHMWQASVLFPQRPDRPAPRK